MPTLEENRFWDSYDWPQDGDEWTDQAAFCGMPYSMWKQDLISAFIFPYVAKKSTVLELAMGHGRWTPFLAQRARRYIGVDFGPSCVKFCRARFANLFNTEFHVNDGRALPMIASNSVQFIWSFDSFVHIEPDITAGYMAEFARVLSTGGRCVIHHPGAASSMQRARGGRSEVSADFFARQANAHGLGVLGQADSWGPGKRSHTKLFADCVSMLEKSALGSFEEE